MPDLPSAVIAVDVGGTAIKAAVSTHDGIDLATRTVPTPVAAGPDAVITAIVDTITELQQAVDGQAVIEGVGLIPLGLVDPVAGIALFSANASWKDLPIRSLVAQRIGLPVAIDHDVRVAGLAELTSGAAKGVSEALFVSIGTGVAAAVITGGAVVSGARGLAGEFGHIPAVPGGDRCACGQYGCVETYASAAAISRRYRAETGQHDITAEQVIGLAAQGDSVAVAIWEQALDALARALVGHILVMDPALIVIGGGMANAGSELLEPLSRRVSAGLAFRTAPPIVIGAYGEHAGRVGAALIGWRAVEHGR